MAVGEVLAPGTGRLENLWDEDAAAGLDLGADQPPPRLRRSAEASAKAEGSAKAADPLRLLRYRSNLLGADLRITNFAGGNTSAKFDRPDPLTGDMTRVLAVKGSGGDLGSIDESGFAVLRLDALERLVSRYRGEAYEDEMVDLYPLCAFGGNRVAASIDTPLHALLPFAHVDHLHPDWAIALAASANGERKLEEFNARYGRHLAWIPWKRPGFELAMMIRRAVQAEPACDGLVLASHGLFTWGDTARGCYASSIATIDQLGAFVDQHRRRSTRPLFGGPASTPPETDRAASAARLLPRLRGHLSSTRRVVAHWNDSEDARTFAGSAWAAELCRAGTSCPDHFLRTRICPMFVPPDGSLDECLDRYRREYVAYYQSFAQPGSATRRDANPSVVVVPELGVFGFGKDKREARITSEFFLNAIHVMAGATALEDEESRIPALGAFHNYVALSRAEAFRIEYWALEEAKLRRQPPEREFSRTVALVVGGGSGIGREVAIELAGRGAHVVIADRDLPSAEAVWNEVRASAPEDMGMALEIDLTSRSSITSALRAVVRRFGGFDILVNTAAIYPTPDRGVIASEEIWAKTLHVNVTGNHVLVEEAAAILREQNLPASIVLTSSANAVVPKRGSEAYDVSKAAVSHLIRELAVGLGPLIRVNGIAPATVVAGSAMFPRHRVIDSLRKYAIAFDEAESTEALRTKLAEFYAARTITKRPVLPRDCANAICWLAGNGSATTTGHIIPVDGGLPDAFVR
jgi:rhamnulose-1-phosphate aldolase/alcohol dehydrogenase